MNDTLKHFGKKGMRWGVRKKRSASQNAKASEQASTNKKGGKVNRKKLSEMSTEELRTLTTRLELEKKYKEITAQERSAGRKLVESILMESAKNTITPIVTSQMQGIASQLFKTAKP